jgi:hypothetical protein
VAILTGSYPGQAGEQPVGDGEFRERLRGYFGELFGWEFDTSSPVARAVSEPDDYGFVNRNTTSDGTGIPGGVGGRRGPPADTPPRGAA